MNDKTYQFNTIFRELHDGSITPQRTITISGATIGPGVALGPGVNIDGITISQIKGKVLAGHEDRNGTITLTGYYEKST